MHDTWDIVKTQEHEDVPNPWEHVYKWDGSKYVVVHDPQTFWANLFPKASIDFILDDGALISWRYHSEFIINEMAYSIAKTMWS